MFKVKVIVPFNDKYTGKEYKLNDVLEMSASRINEILKAGRYIELLEPEQLGGKKNK